MTRLSGVLRLIMGFMIVSSMVAAGFFCRSPWIVLIATPPFTALYAAGKWQSWRRAFELGVRQIVFAILASLPIQAIVAGVFYLIGLGISMVVGRNQPLMPLSSGDWLAAALLFAAALGVACLINVLETPGAVAAPVEPAALAAEDVDSSYAEEDAELDIDPTPLTPEAFYRSPGYWKRDILQDAIEQRDGTVIREPIEASEESMSQAEERLGVRLPQGLRRLYRIMDGGYVGALYVPLKPDPGPFYDDWRGAFAIDYSSLASLDRLRTVYDHYQDFTYDPEELPENADKLMVLQARYGDMTLLDYSRGPEPRVLLVDFERLPADPVDISYEDFDSFFAALRRPKRELPMQGDRLLGWRSVPFSERSPETPASAFWVSGDSPHRVANVAASREDGSQPAAKATDQLIAETEERLGVRLPEALLPLWRQRNGGRVAYAYLRTSAEGAPYEEKSLPDGLLPLEYVVTLATLSDRIMMPSGKPPLAANISEPEKIVVLEANKNEALLLDYRKGPAPGVILAGDIESQGLDEAIACDSVADFFRRLRGPKPKN